VFAVRTRRQEGVKIGDRHHRRTRRPSQLASADRRRGDVALHPRPSAETGTRQRFPIHTNNRLLLLLLLLLLLTARANLHRLLRVEFRRQIYI